MSDPVVEVASEADHEVGDYDRGLERRAANHQPLTPLTFLRRAADVFPERTAIVHGSMRRSYAEFYARSCRLASALRKLGIGRGDTVSALLPNVPAMLECHHGVPMAGAVLHSVNTRLDAATVAFQLDHARSKVLVVDAEFAPLAREALALAENEPTLVLCDDPEFDGPREGVGAAGAIDYEALLSEGDPRHDWPMPRDEWDAISINYTSGTTGDPKGVVYHHRGAYLLAQANALTCAMGQHAVYLWTLPMFHCNGWCFPWTLSVVAGTHVCLRQVRADAIWSALAEHEVTHLCGAPVVMALIDGAEVGLKRALDRTVRFCTAAAPPPEALLARMGEAGFAITHLYGLTETYGPAVVNEWHSEWSDLPSAQRASRMARQGVRYLPLEDLAVLDPDTMRPVPADGETLGEVMFRGNVVMKGYFRNETATQAAFADGWFHSGDLGVVHPDGYVQLKDRSKDIIISGGENISSIEVEEALYRHPAVAVCAVVAIPHERWGETPCAFVELTPGAHADAEALRAWCRERLAGYKVPSTFVFETVPRTSTGKIQKFALRTRAAELAT